MNSFQEIQMLSLLEGNTSVKDTRVKMNKIVEHFENAFFYEEQLQFFSEMRKLKPETLKEVNSFMVTDDYPFTAIPEELRHESLGFCRSDRIIYSGRYVYPIKDIRGDVAGFVGYDKFESPKYLDSRNYAYKAKTTMLAGMERMEEIYGSKEPVFVTEGYVCKLWLQEQTLLSLATLGAYISPYEYTILRRLGDRVVMVNDGDEAGSKSARIIKRELPKAKVIQPFLAKDVDDTRQLENSVSEDIVAELLSIAKNPFVKRHYFR